MKLRLIVEIDAEQRNDAEAIASVVNDYAHEQFDILLNETGREMSIKSYTNVVRPKSSKP